MVVSILWVIPQRGVLCIGWNPITLFLSALRSGVRTVINLQQPGEHASCGNPLEPDSGFSYRPEAFMEAGSTWQMFCSSICKEQQGWWRGSCRERQFKFKKNVGLLDFNVKFRTNMCSHVFVSRQLCIYDSQPWSVIGNSLCNSSCHL